jgi:hypothetical protein
MIRKIGIILLVFVAFYTGAHFWIRWRNTVTDDVTKLTRLVECDPNEVRSLNLTSRAEDEGVVLSFTRTDTARPGLSSSAQLTFSEWRMHSPLKGEADAAVLTRFASMFCELYDPIPTRDDLFSEGAVAAESLVFGLEGGKESGEHILRFGPVTEDRMNVVRYVSPRGAERTIKIQPKLLQLASLRSEDYLNRRVMRITADNVNVAIVFAGGKEKFTLEREGAGWRVLIAGKVQGGGSEEATKYVNRLTTLRALKADEDSLSPSACEDSASKMSVRVEGVGDRQETVYFQYGKTGPLTACNTARDALFTIHRDMVRYLETPVVELLERDR